MRLTFRRVIIALALSLVSCLIVVPTALAASVSTGQTGPYDKTVIYDLVPYLVRHYHFGQEDWTIGTNGYNTVTADYTFGYIQDGKVIPYPFTIEPHADFRLYSNGTEQNHYPSLDPLATWADPDDLSYGGYDPDNDFQMSATLPAYAKLMITDFYSDYYGTFGGGAWDYYYTLWGSGTTTLMGGSRPAAGRDVPLTLKFFDPNQVLNSSNILTAVPWYTRSTNGGDLVITSTSSNAISFEILNPVPTGEYQLALYSPHNLVNLKTTWLVNNSINIDMGKMLEGNANDDTIINSLDFSILAYSYLKVQGQPGFDSRADFDRTGAVNTLDFSVLAANYLKYSPQVVGGDSFMGGEGLLTLGTADLTLQPSTQTVSVDDTFNVTIQAAAGSQQVNGIDAFIDFDSDYLDVVSVTNGTALPIETYNQYDNDAGTIDFSNGKTGTALPSGTFTVATIQFRAKAATAGTSLTFVQTESRNTEAAYNGDSVLGSLTGATVVIQ